MSNQTQKQTVTFSPGVTVRRVLAAKRRQKKSLMEVQKPTEVQVPEVTKIKKPPQPKITNFLANYQIPRKRRVESTSNNASPSPEPSSKKQKTSQDTEVNQTNMPMEFFNIMESFKDNMMKEFRRSTGGSQEVRKDRRWLQGVERKYRLTTNYHVFSLKNQYDGLCDDDKWSDVPLIPIKGNLRRAAKFWATTDKAGWSHNIVQHGYRIPFVTLPSRAFFDNNLSATDEPDFVEESILKLLKNGLVKRVAVAPLVVNPLSVAVQASGKKRLILDASPINPFIYKQKFKLEDYSVAEEYLRLAQYAFSFDLEAAYNHLEIHVDSVRYLGFSWIFNGRREWFQYTVLCFGISTGPFVFTKFLRPLVRRWRAEGIQLVLYLDDGLGLAPNFDRAKQHSQRVKSDLQEAGFCINQKKSFWEPTKHLTWLGLDIDLDKRILSTPEGRRQKVLSLARNLIVKNRASPRQVAKLAGNIISMRLVIGDLATIATKALCRYTVSCLEGVNQWDFYYKLTHTVKEEIAFWIRNMLQPEISKQLIPISPPTVTVFSDASAVAAAAYIEETDIKYIKNFTLAEQSNSSTWRELKIIQTAADSWCQLLEGKTVSWFTDNQPITYIIQKGSMKEDLNELASQLWQTCTRYRITLKLSWIPREQNKTADSYSRAIDKDDWRIHPTVFKELNVLFGPHDFDRFADDDNTVCKNFNSLNWEKGSQGVNAFSFNWAGYNNWVVPPPYLLIKAVKHLQACKAHGTLVMAEWPSNPVWPLLMPNRFPAAYVKDTKVFSPGHEAIVAGKYTKSVFSNGKLKNDIVAFRLDFSGAS